MNNDPLHKGLSGVAALVPRVEAKPEHRRKESKRDKVEQENNNLQSGNTREPLLASTSVQFTI